MQVAGSFFLPNFILSTKLTWYAYSVILFQVFFPMAAPKLAISLQWTQLAMSDILTIISGTGTITQSMLMKDIGTDMRLID